MPTTMPLSELRVHEAAECVPRMRPDEWTAFLVDVNKNGVQDPITVQDGGIVLDGRHRLEAAKLAGAEGIPVRVVNYGASEQVEYIIRTAIMRRQLNDDQRAVLAARFIKPVSDARKVERASRAGSVGGRNHPKPEGQLVVDVDDKLKHDSRREAATQFNVSVKKVQNALGVERADPAVADRVLNGEITMREAKNVVQPKEVQPEVRIKTSTSKSVHLATLRKINATCDELCELLNRPSLQVSIREVKIKATEVKAAVSKLLN